VKENRYGKGVPIEVDPVVELLNRILQMELASVI